MSGTSGATTAAASSTSAAGDAINAEELEETVSRLFSHPGVQAVLILNRAGDVLVERTTASLRSYNDDVTIDAPTATPTASASAAAELGASNHPPTQQSQQQQILPKRLNHLLQSVRSMLGALPDPRRGGQHAAGGVDDLDDLGFLQIRSADGGREVLVAPHRGYVLAVIKMPTLSS